MSTVPFATHHVPTQSNVPPDRLASPLLSHVQFGLNAHPFERQDLFRRVLPFALISLLAEASLALSVSSISLGYFYLSLVLLGAVAAAFFLPWTHFPAWTSGLVPVLAVAFVLALILASGTASSGVGIVILVPLVWTALYHRRIDSFLVVAAIVAAEVVTSLVPVQESPAIVLRRVVCWVALGLVISIATNSLRTRLHHSLDQREQMLRRTLIFAVASETLTTILDPDEVLQTASKLAAQLVSPAEPGGRRAQYNRVRGGMIHIVAQYDETGYTIDAPIPLSEQPNIMEVLLAGAVTQLPLSIASAGPRVKALIKSLGVTSSVYIPVRHEGEIDGILSVPIRGGAFEAGLIDSCRSFGHLVELALGNAYAHQALKEQATIDTLTGLPNRRAFDLIMERRPRKGAFSILVIDLDGLKQTNDTFGHRAGDELLILAAHAMQCALREGDLVARIGGDEFAAFLFDADHEDAVSVAERILEWDFDLLPETQGPSFSIGVAKWDPGSDPRDTLNAADAAMYRAKREGGGRVAIATRGDIPALSSH